MKGLNLEFIIDANTNKLVLLHMDDILITPGVTSVPMKMRDIFGKVCDFDYKENLKSKYQRPQSATRRTERNDSTDSKHIISRLGKNSKITN